MQVVVQVANHGTSPRPAERVSLSVNGNKLPVAQVDLPDQLKAWEAGGRKAFDFLTDDAFPADATEIKMPSWITALPGWLCRHSALQTLHLRPCDALTGMPDLSELPQLQARRTMAGVTRVWE